MKAFKHYFAPCLLLTSGLTAAGIALTILFAPAAFYASYGIDLSCDLNLANELRAPAGLLGVAGVLMLVGAFRNVFRVPALGIAAVTFLSYGLSRGVGMALDGVPNNALISAAVLENALGVIATAHLMYLRRIASRRSESQAGVGNHVPVIAAQEIVK